MCLFARIDATTGDFHFGVFVVNWLEVLLFVCLCAKIDPPMGVSIGCIGVIWSEVLLFVCLSTRIDTPTADFQLGVFGII